MHNASTGPCETLRTQLQARLETLRTEQAHGQQALMALDQRRAALAETLLRISGAIQVLEELLQEANGEVTMENGE